MIRKEPATEDELIEYLKGARKAAVPEQILNAIKPTQRALTKEEMENEKFKDLFYKVKPNKSGNMDRDRKSKNKKVKATRKKCKCR